MSAQIKRSQAGRCSNPAEIAAVAQQFGLRVLDDAGVAIARALAVRLVPGGVAEASVFQAVQHAAGAAVFGFYEESTLTALLAAFPLNEYGRSGLACGGFDALQVDISLIAQPGEIPAAYYGWGFAAATKEGGRAVVKASAQIHRELFWATPTYARAVTADGLRALTAIGFQQAGVHNPSLLWINPSLSVQSR